MSEFYSFRHLEFSIALIPHGYIKIKWETSWQGGIDLVFG